MNKIILLHVFSCWFMTGCIWLVQILIYPSLGFVGESEFQAYHQSHMKRITWVVAPMMALELISGVWLLAATPNASYFFNLASIFLLWGLTGFLNVPTHRDLKFDNNDSKRLLVLCNWPRTVIWTLRSGFWISFFFV
jgi:uncharacterized membrane protein